MSSLKPGKFEILHLEQAKIKEIYAICKERTQSETQILELKMDRLRGKPQSFFGIKPELESATKWNRAIYELSLLRDCVRTRSKREHPLCAERTPQKHTRNALNVGMPSFQSIRYCHRRKSMLW